MSRELDFTPQKYSKMLDAIHNAGYRTIAVCDHLSSPDQTDIVVLRHDVDRRPRTALRMARAEQERGMRATYYFRYLPSVYDKVVVREISEMGHEVGYHYEVLDKAQGDVEKALALFRKELAEMRADFEVSTVCMHGSPLQPWKNLNIFEGKTMADFDVLGEAYLSMDFSDLAYFTDTGRRWDRKFSVKDHVPDNPSSGYRIKRTDRLVREIERGTFPRLYLVVHPNRWNYPGYEWLKEYIYQNTKNVGKALLMQRES